MDTKVALIVLGLSLVASASMMEDFEDFTHRFGKVYRSDAEAQRRAAIFSQNVEKIKAHNERFQRKEVSYSKKIDQFTDMTRDEFLATLTPFDGPMPEFHHDEDYVQLLKQRRAANGTPDQVNWVAMGGVSSVKTEGNCRACTAFATVASLDTCFFIETGSLPEDMSEQFLVNCANGHKTEDGKEAYGCQGAWLQAYFDYLQTKSNGRIQTEAAYPYTAKDDECRATDDGWLADLRMKSWKNIYTPEEDLMMQWLAEDGVIVTNLDSSSFDGYQSGVLDSADCCDSATDGNCWLKNNHAVAVVGYGHDDESGLDYWLVKNSWGESWGDKGYIKVKKGTGHCGIFGYSASGAMCRDP